VAEKGEKLMSKYINADELISALNDTIEKHKNSDNFTRTVRAAENMITIIKRIPSADVVEVKHGEWERIESDASVDFRCSTCHRYRFHNGEMLRKYKFCPNCGADMRGETE
jgi:hypothetical protein